jgi:phosphocarrier protein HPr
MARSYRIAACIFALRHAKRARLRKERDMAVLQEVVIRHKTGLHARPAALFVKAAIRFSSQIKVENLTKQKGPVNAKSIMSLLTVGVQANDRIRITANGADEEEAVATLYELVSSNFGEAE